MIRLLVPVIAGIGLSACVSNQAPDVLQVEQQLNGARQNTDSTDPANPIVMAGDVGKQKLLPVVDGAMISVPQPSPKKSNSSQLALVSQTAVSDPARRENFTNGRQENNAAAEQDISAVTQKRIAVDQPIADQSVKKPNLLALLFKRKAKSENEIKQPLETVAVASINQISEPAGDVVVPSLRPARSGKLAAVRHSAVDNNLSSPVIAGTSHVNSKQVSQNAAGKQQNSVRKKPGFFALLLQRKKRNERAKAKVIDDRNNAILLSSRTSSRANRATTTPITAGLADISNVKNKQNAKNIQLASAAGLSRNAVNGIVTQHSGVNVDCITPGVITILQYVEQKYGRKPVVTSGYRSPSRNRRAGGARNSMHIYCRAVDIQVKGISKWQLAKFLRTVPGRGGVGTYCRTNSVHIDTGPKRDWHYPCRRKSKRRSKA